MNLDSTLVSGRTPHPYLKNKSKKKKKKKTENYQLTSSLGLEKKTDPVTVYPPPPPPPLCAVTNPVSIPTTLGQYAQK